MNLSSIPPVIIQRAATKIQARVRGQQLRNKQLLEAASKVALHWAAKAGKTEVVEELVKAGADVNVTNKVGNTALCEATIQGHLEMVKLLVKAGANLDTRDYEGRTPLQLTQYIGNEISVKNAIEEGKTQLIKLVKEMPTKIEETLKSLDKLRNLPAEIIKIIVDDYFNPEQKEQAKKYIEEREEAAAATKIQMRIFVVS